MGIRTCKNFWKMGLKNVFAFFRLFTLMGIRTCKNVWKMGLKNVFAFFRLLPYMGIRTCKNFWKMGLKNVFAFFFSPYMGIRTCKNVWKMWLKDVFAFLRLLPYMGIRTCKNFWKMGLKFFFCVLSALINVKLCETSFWVKKVGKNFFKYWNFYPIRGSELVKIFEKWGWKMFLRFFGFHPIWGSELVNMFGNIFFAWLKNCVKCFFLCFFGFYPIWGSELVKIFEKWGWNFFLRFFGFRSTCKKFVKIGLKNVFAFFRLLPYMGIRTCKIFENVVEKCFCVFSALINVKLCETCFLSKKSCRSFFSKIETFTL